MRYAFVLWCAASVYLLASARAAELLWQPEGLSGERVSGVASCADGTRYAFVTGKGVYRHRPNVGWFPEGVPCTGAVSIGIACGELSALLWGGGIVTQRDGGWLQWTNELRERSVYAVAAWQGAAFAATDTGIFRSDDHGMSWQVLPALSCGPVYALAVRGDALYAGGCGVHVSRDGGASWSSVALPEGVVWIRALEAVDGTLYLAASHGSLYEQRGEDSAFMPVPHPPVGQVHASACAPGLWYLGTGDGVYCTPTPALAAPTLPPEETRALPNFPNPFNPETWIPFTLAETAEVEIVIYDLAGARVRALALGTLSAGQYDTRNRAARWDGKNDRGEPVASGAYVYEFRAGSTHFLRRLIVAR